MGRRDKSKFEKWFSLSRHQRRLNAKNLSNQIDTNFRSQKKKLIANDKIIYTHGSFNNIEKHFTALKNEFSGQSELCYTHAKIIVLMRRDFESSKYFAIFENLWYKETKFLLKNLNTRWLISAADTFTDYSNDDALRGLSIACSCLLNTVKIQESERFIANTQNHKDDKEKIIELSNEERVALFDGISVFKVGTDDTLRNMRWRIDKAAKINIAGQVLLEVFIRLQKFDTVYKRLKDKHAREKTGWW
ncbi:conserved hypothetical protein [Abyssogena phaseoliformis symbiont OG214]|uniref:hypothetical protein n=1 Tax=Abyssogena phaseoliformis symbiont TaxID=596095 RepID=UPI001914FDF1|nr:hypothetical protein [Abyssogena phaseoliformis symbiont]BBB23029.1 conserved hypothetical protein [Abyssogena phaseoliformis symbiont OG214]